MKRELFAVFKNGQFIEAALVADQNYCDDADRYIRMQEKKLGQLGFTYLFGDKAWQSLPLDYTPRVFLPRPSNRKKQDRDIFVKYFKHAQDDGVDYEK